MNSEDLRLAMLELLHEDTEKGKTWFFPSNVNSQYILFLGLGVKQFAYAFLTSIISTGLVILLFRKSSAFFLIMYSLIALISFGSVWAFYTVKPITDRPNISISDFLKERKEYQKRQKKFCKKPKDMI